MSSGERRMSSLADGMLVLACVVGVGCCGGGGGADCVIVVLVIIYFVLFRLFFS